MILLISLTFFVFLIWFFLLSAYNNDSLSSRLIFAGLLGSCQIILSEIVLGLLEGLTAPYVITLNSLFSLCLLVFCARRNRAAIQSIFKDDIRSLGMRSREVLCFENIFLITLSIVITGWMLLAAYFLPPRSVDDLTYHLPPIYEYVIKHKIFLLPLDLRYHFAFPLNAEFLYMWPVVILHTQRWVEFVQWIISLYGVIVIYGLGRLIHLTPKNSLFTGLLFLFVPVVLTQAESTYIDTTVSVFLLASLYFGMRFYTAGKPRDLYGAGLALGTILGMKYSMVLFCLLYQLLIFSRRRALQARTIAVYFFLIFLMGSFFYIRNFLELGNPVFPVNFFTGETGISEFTGFKNISIKELCESLLAKIWLLWGRDVGIGTMNGGFGILFWGIGLAAWAYIFLLSIKNDFRQENFHHFFLWLQPVVGFTLLLGLPRTALLYGARYGIFIIPIAFLAIGVLLKLFPDYRPLRLLVKGTALLSSCLSITLLSISRQPAYGITQALKDSREHKFVSEFKYYWQGTWAVPHMRFVAEPLDYISTESSQGLSCYIAGDASFMWLANIYGAKLQNRVWNLEDSPSSLPDVYIFQNFAPGQFYLKEKITLEETALDTRNSLIIQTPYLQIFMSNQKLAVLSVKESLCRYYEATFPKEIDWARRMLNQIDRDTPVILDQFLGVGFRYLELTGELKNKLYWVPPEFASDLAVKEGIQEAVTFADPYLP